jgi:hypothetical protein
MSVVGPLPLGSSLPLSPPRASTHRPRRAKTQLDTKVFLNQWTTQKAAYNKRDLLLYALGIGATDLKFAYENDSDFAAFPTFRASARCPADSPLPRRHAALVLLFKGDSQDVVTFPSPVRREEGSAAADPLARRP